MHSDLAEEGWSHTTGKHQRRAKHTAIYENTREHTEKKVNTAIWDNWDKYTVGMLQLNGVWFWSNVFQGN